MADETLQAEVDRLRTEVASFRERELAELRSALAAARTEASHYRAEAQRNADVGRQIQSSYEGQVATLKTQLEALRTLNVNGRRFAGTDGGS